QTATDVWAQETRFPLSVAGRWLVEPRWIRGMRDARVVAISASTAADLRGHGVPVTGIVPPGWEAVPPRPRAAMPEPPRLLFVGRLSRTKRPGEALRAFSLLRARCPQATLDVVGDGYLAGALRREAVPGVSWHGRTDEATKRALLG